MSFQPFIRFLAILAALGLAGCTTSGEPETPKTFEIFSSDYETRLDAGYQLPKIPVQKIDPKYHRQIVKYYSPEPSGTIIVDVKNRFLYYKLRGNKAVRYGVSVGREGFSWEGEAYISFKREWPRWTPTPEMAKRDPSVRRFAKNGMNPGLRNPLGARALYLFDTKTRQDTYFRLHGTPHWRSIGKAASSGCIRLMNQDIIDLYNRVEPGRTSRVIVKQS